MNIYGYATLGKIYNLWGWGRARCQTEMQDPCKNIIIHFKTGRVEHLTKYGAVLNTGLV